MNELTSTILDQLVIAGRMLESNPSQGMEFLLSLRPLLQQQTWEADGCHGFANWAFFYKDLRMYAAHLPPGMTVQTVNQEVLERLQFDRETLPHNDLKGVRDLLREVRAELATEALNAGRIAEAKQHVEACFAIKSGDGEYMDPFAAYVVLRARILMVRGASGEVRAARKRFLESLLQVEKKARREYRTRLTLESAPQDFLAWLEHPDFLAFKTGHAVEKLRCGRKGEKWPAALKRVERATAALWPAEGDDDSSAPMSVIRHAPETAAALAAHEARIGCAIPPSLRALYLKHGPFSLREPDCWGSLHVFASHSDQTMFLGLQLAIEDVWGGRPEFRKSFTEEQLQRLNREFIVFGHFFHNDNSYSHLYFTRSGGFGSLFYHQDDWAFTRELVEEMLGDPDDGTGTLDDLISTFANDVIEGLIEDRDTADNEA